MTNIDRRVHRRFRYRDYSELLSDITALDLPIPWNEDPSPLLRTIQVGVHTLPNRMAVHPMEGFDANPGGGPSELAFRRYRRFASGGSGLLWFEATSVVEEGRSNPNQMYLHDGNVAEFRKLVTETHRAASESMGQDHRPILILQLTHSGRWARPRGTRQPLIAHHHPMLAEKVDIDANYPLVTDDELDRLQDTFVSAARMAASAGFDGVDIKACHGYLCSELLAAYTREGKYGGSFENRTRFLLETVKRIQSEVDGIFVTSRMNAFDGLPHPFGFGVSEDDPDQPDLTEPIEVLRRLRDSGCPVANMTLGVPYCRPHLGRPFDRAVAGTPKAPEHPLVGVARFLEITGKLQKALPDLPLIGTGYSWLRQFFPSVGAGVISQNGASIIGLGRMAFAYPDFARDLTQHGSLDVGKSCIGCSGCTELMRAGQHTGCIIRDRETYKPPGKGDGS